MSKRGPRSAAGKAAIANNHLKHGLAAAAIVLPSEDAAGWKRFHEDVLARFDADDPVEIALASHIAELLWRLRRVVRAEQQFVSVDQIHRDALAYDRKQVTAAAAQGATETPPPADDDSTPEKRKRLGQKLGPYAEAYIASEAASSYRETLPVLLPGDAALDKIMRYEAHLSRLLNHALHELEALQERRRGNAAPLARLDIT